MQFRVLAKVCFLLILLMATSSFAKAAHNQARSMTSESIPSGIWRLSPHSVIQTKNFMGINLQDCVAFEIRLEGNLKIKIECKGSSKIENLLLTSQGNLTVTRSRNQITITRFEYLHRKIRTSNLELASVRVPYVEEIVQIKKQANGDLALYLETFKVDEFGRIVQNAFIQAHGLTSKNLNISSN